MIICVECKRELRCDKNSVGADFGFGHVYASDRWVCPECGKLVLLTNDNACFDLHYTFQNEYLKMKQEEE